MYGLLKVGSMCLEDQFRSLKCNQKEVLQERCMVPLLQGLLLLLLRLHRYRCIKFLSPTIIPGLVVDGTSDVQNCWRTVTSCFSCSSSSGYSNDCVSNDILERLDPQPIQFLVSTAMLWLPDKLEFAC